MIHQEIDPARFVVTVTLNPALDRVYSIPQFTPHHFYRMPSSETIESGPGGKGIRIALELKRYHRPVVTMGFVGGVTARLIAEAMQNAGISTFFTFIEEETRTNTIIFDPEKKTLTEIIQPGPQINAEDWQLFLDDLSMTTTQANFMILGGSLPIGCPQDAYAKMIKICRDANLPTLLHTAPEFLLPSLSAGAEYICPDLRGRHHYIDIQLQNIEDYIKAGRQTLSQNSNAKAVFFINHIEAPILITPHDIYELEPSDLKIANMLGYADVFIGAFVHALLDCAELPEAFQFGYAAGLAKVESDRSFGDIAITPQENLRRIKIKKVS